MSVRSRVLTVLVLAIAAAAMIASNSHFTILDDESTIVTVAGHPVLPTMELFLLGGDQHEHPPLSDVALHLWLIATNYSFSMLRVFANLFYLAGAVVLALAARKAAGMSAYWACLLLALLWPFSFQYGRITGWYAVSWFLIALLTWIYLKILDSGGSGAWTAFGMVSVLFVWTNYFSAAILLLLLADLVLFHRELARKRIRSFTVVIGVVALSFLPLLRMAALEVTANVTSMASHPTLKSAIATLGYPLFSAFASTAVAPWYLPLSIPAFLAAAVLLVSAWGGAGRRWLVYWALAMILLGLSVHLDVKRVLFLLPWLLLAMALAIAGGGEHGPNPHSLPAWHWFWWAGPELFRVVITPRPTCTSHGKRSQTLWPRMRAAAPPSSAITPRSSSTSIIGSDWRRKARPPRMHTLGSTCIGRTATTCSLRKTCPSGQTRTARLSW